MINTNILFETDRLGFRLWKSSDKAIFAQMNKDQEVMKFFPKTMTEAESDDFADRIMEGLIANGYGLWAVEEKCSGDFIGFIGLFEAGFEASFTPCIEIGWRLHKNYWNKGYATEGAMKCLEVAFQDYGIEEVYSFTAAINRPSINVMEKIGLHRMSLFEHPRIEENNQLRTHVLYYLKSNYTK